MPAVVSIQALPSPPLSLYVADPFSKYAILIREERRKLEFDAFTFLTGGDDLPGGIAVVGRASSAPLITRSRGWIFSVELHGPNACALQILGIRCSSNNVLACSMNRRAASTVHPEADQAFFQVWFHRNVPAVRFLYSRRQ